MVKREVVQLVTPGTIIDQNASEAKENNYLTALHEKDGQYGFAYADLSTGEIKVATLTSTESLLNELMSLQTKEVVIDDSLSQPTQTLLEQLKVLMSDQPEVMPKRRSFVCESRSPADIRKANCQAIASIFDYNAKTLFSPFTKSRPL